MAGKNKISCLSNLNQLRKLDVLVSLLLMWFYDRFKKTSSDQLQRFLSDIFHVSDTGVLFDKLSERHARDVLVIGGSLMLKEC